jgi:site-specific recombinase XerD
MTPTILPHNPELIPTTPDFLARLREFGRDVQARNLSPSTLRAHVDSTARMLRWFETAVDSEPDLPALVADIRKSHVQAFLIHLRDSSTSDRNGSRPVTAGTVKHYYLSIQQFFKYLAAESLIPASPMATMKAPKTPVSPPPVISEPLPGRRSAECRGPDPRPRPHFG